MADDADRIIELYDRHARAWETQRGRELFERPWLDRFLALVPRGGSVLDLGCGSGEPIARTLIEAGYGVTGVDSSPAMIALCESRFPDARWLVADMRGLSLGQRFDGILAWDSFFHLRPGDQRAMFPVFRDHAAPRRGAALHLRPASGVAMGDVAGRAPLPREPRPGRIPRPPRRARLCGRRLRTRGPRLRCAYRMAGAARLASGGETPSCRGSADRVRDEHVRNVINPTPATLLSEGSRLLRERQVGHISDAEYPKRSFSAGVPRR